MPKVNVEVSDKIIDWILENIDSEKLTPEILEMVYNLSDDKNKPTMKQVLDLSKKINIPFGYFFLKEPPKENLDIIKYRTINSVKFKKPSRNLIDTINYMERVQDWMKSYCLEINAEDLKYVGSVSEDEDAQDFAKLIRKEIGLKDDWFTKCKDASESFSFLRKLFGEIGIIVMMSGVVGQNNKRKLNLEEFRAFVLIDEYAPLIFINSNDSNNGKLFSLLHEAVHIWLGTDELYNDFEVDNGVSKTEKLCNAVTAEILVPMNSFRKEWSKVNENDLVKKIKKISQFYKCSQIVIARRALDMNFINAKEYQVISNNILSSLNEKFESKSSSGGDYYRTQKSRIDNRFLLALNDSTLEGKTSFSEAYRLSNTSRKTFSALTEYVRGKMQ